MTLGIKKKNQVVILGYIDSSSSSSSSSSTLLTFSSMIGRRVITYISLILRRQSKLFNSSTLSFAIYNQKYNNNCKD